MLQTAMGLAVLGGALSASTASAIILVAGDDDIIASGEIKPVGGVVVAGGVPVPFKALTFDGTLTTTVISGDESNELGGLTFVYQFTNLGSSPNAINRFTISDPELPLFATDVSYQIPADDLVVPSLMGRTTADVVGFFWIGSPIGDGVVKPGSISAILVIQTNANFWKPILANVIDGSTANPASFGPTVPEPSTVALSGLGVVGLALGAVGRRLRRARSQVPAATTGCSASS
jgi:hypothetical protein